LEGNGKGSLTLTSSLTAARERFRVNLKRNGWAATPEVQRQALIYSWGDDLMKSVGNLRFRL
jgi:hypothetical protein